MFNNEKFWVGFVSGIVVAMFLVFAANIAFENGKRSVSASVAEVRNDR